ncbi:hypothetical protein RI543_001558 [Arxiozyma heterogenica]|uniref:Uncharacterized protein n=2 Tax=Arxiozyma heterogenica TaxID=278026 RepID=A0AAN7WLZ2_9SACH|nr:hypothetical protein RI543_001558 [Kazachstania heterogenica]
MSRAQTVRNQKQLTQAVSTKPKQKPDKKTQQPRNTISSKGNIVGTNNTLNQSTSNINSTGVVDTKKLSPREAARLAAEKRLEESTKELTKGKLGKKLAEQRGLRAQ